jgi:integrase
MWVVSLSVPTSLRATLRNRQGKPLTRLERSTGERDEARARRAYPKLLAELEGELLQKSRDAGVEMTIHSAVERAIGKTYQEVVDDAKSLSTVTELGRYLQTSDATIANQITIRNGLFINKIDPSEELRKRKLMARFATWGCLRNAGLELDINGGEIELAEKSLRWALVEAGKYGEQIQEKGYLAKVTEDGKGLRQAAGKPNPITIWEVAQHKAKWNELSQSAKQAHDYALRAWAKIIKKNCLEDINTPNLNHFLEQLVTNGWNGKALSPESANGMATTIASLIKHQSLRDGLERTKPIYRKIKTDKRAAKLQQRDKATKKEDVRKALNHAYLNEKDRFRWLWLLLIDNTTLRVSESLALRWKDLIQIDGSWFFDLQFSKTAEGIRYVPLNDRLKQWLLPERGNDADHVINNSWNQTKKPKDGAGNWTRSLEKKLNLVGRINPHSFRHGAGGDLGYELPEGLKKKLMGHAGGMTDHYTREDLAKLRMAANVIGTEWEPPEPGKDSGSRTDA